MSQETAEGVVLRGVDFSETSRIVTLLTPNRGKLACLAKGARRKNSRLGPVLDTFNRVELIYYWKEGRQVQNLAEASLLDAYTPLKQDLERSAYAGFPLELAYKVAHENEPSRVIYDVLTQGLAGLCAWTGEVRAHACWQVMRLICAAGFAPVMDACVHCGAEVPASPGFSYDGGVTCGRCRADRRLSPAAWAALQALGVAEAACPRVAVPAEVFHVLRFYASRHAETEFKSARVIEEMFGGRWSENSTA